MSKKTPKLVPLELVEINFEDCWIKLRVPDPDPAFFNNMHFGNVLCDLTEVRGAKQPDRKGKK